MYHLLLLSPVHRGMLYMKKRTCSRLYWVPSFHIFFLLLGRLSKAELSCTSSFEQSSWNVWILSLFPLTAMSKRNNLRWQRTTVLTFNHLCHLKHKKNTRECWRLIDKMQLIRVWSHNKGVWLFIITSLLVIERFQLQIFKSEIRAHLRSLP